MSDVEREVLQGVKDRLDWIAECAGLRSKQVAECYATGSELEAIQIAMGALASARSWAIDGLSALKRLKGMVDDRELRRAELLSLERMVSQKEAALEIARKVQAETSELLTQAMRDIERLREAGDALRDIYIRTCRNSRLAPDIVRLRRWDQAKGMNPVDEPLREQIRRIVRVMAAGMGMSPERTEEMAERVIKVIESEGEPTP